MSLTPDAAGTLRRADVRPPSRPLPEHIKSEISGILRSWGLA
jgi:hypothetical protein